MEVVPTVMWAPSGDAVRIIDQRELPARLVQRDLRTVEDICEAIATLSVRGAPAIGVAAAMGLAIVAGEVLQDASADFQACLKAAGAQIRSTRPTAVNLAWAIDRMLACAAHTTGDPKTIASDLRVEATAILEEDRVMCDRIGAHGRPLLPAGARVITHCNAGALATAGIGTALAPVYHAAAEGGIARVYACETRPLLQGSRLTAWELARAGVPVTIIADSMAAALMRQGGIDCCIVGADRIAANGDVANKIGTYALALAAHHHEIPFYVAAPSSTLDIACASGDAIRIEERDARELTGTAGASIANADVWNPAFDITPAALVTAIITDQGIHRPLYRFSSLS